MNIIDLSVFKKEDLTITSLTGTTYTISGNFSTEFYIGLIDAYEKISKAKKNDNRIALNLLKEIALEIIKLDTSKNVTMDTINKEFDDFNVLQFLLSKTMEHANKVANDPNSQSPTSN